MEVAEIVSVVDHAAYVDKLLTFSALSCSWRGFGWGFCHCDLQAVSDCRSLTRTISDHTFCASCDSTGAGLGSSSAIVMCKGVRQGRGDVVDGRVDGAIDALEGTERCGRGYRIGESVSCMVVDGVRGD